MLHALPALADSPSWLPVDYAAKTIVDVALRPASSATACPCWHVLNPRTISWVDDVLPALKAAGLRFDIVSPAKWVDLLDKSAEGPGNPTRKLLQFFQGASLLARPDSLLLLPSPADASHVSPCLRQTSTRRPTRR